MDSNIETKKKFQVSKGQSIAILTALTLLYLMNFADRSVLSVALQPMKIALGLTDTEAGIIQSVFSIGVGLLTIPASWLVERWSRRKSLGLMALLWSLATFATGLATKLIHLVFTRAIVGIGEAGYNAGSTGWLSVVFPKERRGLVTGIFAVGTVLGTAAGLIIGGIIITKTGDWRLPFYVFAIPGIFLGIWAFFLKDYATVKEAGEGAISKQYLIDWIKLFKIPSFTYIVLGQSCWSFFFLTFLGWLPTLLIRAYNLDAAGAGSIVGLCGLIAVVGPLLGGFLADRWQKHNKCARAHTMLIVQILNFVLLGVIILICGKVALPIIIVLLALQMIVVANVNPVVMSLIMDVVPLRHRVSSFALSSSILYGFAALGPWFVGAVSDAIGGGATGLITGFLWSLPVLFGAVVFYFILTRYYVKDSQCVIDEVYHEK